MESGQGVMEAFLLASFDFLGLNFVDLDSIMLNLWVWIFEEVVWKKQGLLKQRVFES